MLVFNGSHYEPLEVDANGRLDANIFTTATLDVNVASSSGTIAVDGSAVTQPISAVALPLPTGAATEATLSAVDTKLAGTITVDGSGVTQPISATALPLPTGAATESTLSTLNGKVTAVDTGNVTVSSMPVVQGSHNGTPTDIQVDSHGCVSVKVKELENSGSYGNAWSNASIVASDTSTVIDVSAMSHCNLFILDSDHTSTDTYTVWVSANGTNYHQLHVLYPYDSRSTGTVREDKALLELHGMTHLYIQNEGGAKSAVYGSVYGSP